MRARSASPVRAMPRKTSTCSFSPKYGKIGASDKNIFTRSGAALYLDMKSATNLLTLLAMTLIASAATGCASTVRSPAPTLTVGQEHAEFVVEGRGRVTGGSIACGPTEGGACEGSFEDLWSTRVEAKPEPGWTFAGWKRDVRKVAASPDAPAEDRIVYTASFEKSDLANAETAAASR